MSGHAHKYHEVRRNGETLTILATKTEREFVDENVVRIEEWPDDHNRVRFVYKDGRVSHYVSRLWNTISFNHVSPVGITPAMMQAAAQRGVQFMDENGFFDLEAWRRYVNTTARINVELADNLYNWLARYKEWRAENI